MDDDALQVRIFAVTPSAGRARQAAAERYKPERVRLLLIAESPPRSEDRYFYFDRVAIYDSLFRYTVRLVLQHEPTRGSKSELLDKLRQAGVFLIDLCLEPGHVSKSELRRCVPNLLARTEALAPEHIILFKAAVYDAAFNALAGAGLPVVDARIPFPGSGHQIEFETAMSAALRCIGWQSHVEAP